MYKKLCQGLERFLSGHFTGDKGKNLRFVIKKPNAGKFEKKRQKKDRFSTVSFKV